MCYTQAFPQRTFCHKKSFLVNLFTSSFNWSHREADIFGKKIFLTVSFTSFYFRYVLREVDRKVVMIELVLVWAEALCLWAPLLPIDLTQSGCTNSGIAWTQITSFIMRNVVLTITQLEWLVMTHIIFDRNTEEENI